MMGEKERKAIYPGTRKYFSLISALWIAKKKMRGRKRVVIFAHYFSNIVGL